MAQELSPIDKDILDLLESVRSARDAQIMQDVEEYVQRQEFIERGATLSNALAEEVIKFHAGMMRLNRWNRLFRSLGVRAMPVIKSRPTQINSNTPFSGKHYPISTPPLLQSAPELLPDARVNDGYIFTTYHQHRYDKSLPKLVISHAVIDVQSGLSKRSDNYYIHLLDPEAPVAYLHGPAVNGHQVDHEGAEARNAVRYLKEQDLGTNLASELNLILSERAIFGKGVTEPDDDRFLFPLGLVRQANAELSRRNFR